MNKITEKILVVDDDGHFLDEVSSYFSNEGFEVIKASNGSEGLHKAAQESPDLILLDIFLPDINGFDFLEEIKRRAVPTRVILCTAIYTNLPEVIKGIKSGACDYIIKPSTNITLLNAVRRALVMENTINTCISDSAPLIKELMTRAEKLDYEKSKVEKKVQDLVQKNIIKNWVVRLLSFVSSIIGIIVLFYTKALTNPLLIAPLIIVFFILFFLPIEKISEITAKFPGTEANLKLEKNKALTHLRYKTMIVGNREMLIDRPTALEISHQTLHHFHRIEHLVHLLKNPPENSTKIATQIQDAVNNAKETLKKFIEK